MRPTDRQSMTHFAVAFFVCLAPTAVAQQSTTATASSSTQREAAGQTTASNKPPLSLFGVQIGMTDREVTQILQRKGIRFETSYNDSAWTTNYSVRRQKYVDGISHVRGDTPSSATFVEIDFSEDLPDRPGIGVCTKVHYQKEFDGSPNIDPLWSKIRGDLVKRFGSPADDRDLSILFGDEETQLLKAEKSSSYPIISIQLKDEQLAKRLYDRREPIQREAVARSRPIPKSGKLDY